VLDKPCVPNYVIIFIADAEVAFNRGEFTTSIAANAHAVLAIFCAPVCDEHIGMAAEAIESRNGASCYCRIAQDHAMFAWF